MKHAVLLPLFLINSLLVCLPAQAQKQFKLLALGDSYTIGESVEEPSRWPRLLADSISFRGFPVTQVDIIAKTGWRTDELMAAIEKEQPATDYDFVTLLIGVNNQYQNRPFKQYEDEFPQLLETAIKHAGGDKDKVTVVSTPDYAYTPFGESSEKTGISTELDRYNKFARTTAQSMNVRFVDITPISRQGLAQPGLVAEDDLHPSGEQYARWAGVIINALFPIGAD